MKLALVACALLASASCTSLETRPVASSPVPAPRVGKRARTWEVRCNDEVLGAVVLFQQRGSVRDSVYVVRNPWNQDLGLIDGLGRAYCYLPHEEEPTWVGSGTIASGAQQILGARSACTLVEVGEQPASGPDPRSSAESPGENAPHKPESASFSPDRDPPEGSSPDGGLPQSP